MTRLITDNMLDKIFDHTQNLPHPNHTGKGNTQLVQYAILLTMRVVILNY